MIQLELPWPPSVNTMWRSIGRGRVILSQAGRNYRVAVADTVFSLGPKPMLAGELAVSIAAHPPDYRRRDLDNLYKGVLDSLQHAGVYKDDHQICRLSIERCAVLKPGKLLVSIEEVV